MERREKDKDDVWMKAGVVAQFHTHLCQKSPSSQSFSKRLPTHSVHPTAVERYCERSMGTKAETATGKGKKKKHKCIKIRGRTGAVKKHRRVTRTLKDKEDQVAVQKEIQNHIHKPEMGKKRKTTTCFLPLSKDCLQHWTKIEKQKKKCLVQPNSISFTIVAHSVLMEEAFSGHCSDRFQLGLSSQLFLFFYTRWLFFRCFRVPTCPSLVLLSNTREVCSFHSLRKKNCFMLYKGFCLFI